MSTVSADPTATGTPDEFASTSPSLWEATRRLLKPLASLQVTVALFALSMVLVFFGTLAMMTQGLWVVVDDYFRSFVVWIPIDLVRRFGTVFLTDVIPMSKDATPWPGSIPFPAGWTIGTALLVNLLAAHTVRMKLAWNRAGVIILHAGLVAMLVGELITGLYAVESRMTISIGEETDFVDVTRQMEIAITDSSDPKLEHVSTIPQWMFEEKGKISNEKLPFDVEVLEYWQNTERKFTDKQETGESFPVKLPGTTLWATFSRRSEAAGVDTDTHSDCPSVRVRLTEKGTGTDLGTYFLTLHFYPNYEQTRRIYKYPEQTVTVGGKTYYLLLRNERIFKPYTVRLNKFEHGKYPGTEIPKDFASTVTVTEKDTGDQREVRIWMNNPLRYDGDSLFQSEVLYNDSGTVLQVVRNPGRLLPYISCTLVVIGMIWHFLIRFLASNRAGRTPLARRKAAATGGSTETGWTAGSLVSIGILLVVLAWLGSKIPTPKPAENGIDYYALGEIPVRDGGRLMPLETLAKTTLQSISNRTVVKNERGDQTATPMEWLVDVLDSPSWNTGPGTKHKIFRIENEQVLAKLDLPRRPGFFEYSLDEIYPKLPTLLKELEAIRTKREEGRAIDVYDTKMEELGKRIKQYQRIAGAHELQVVPPSEAGGEWISLRDVDQAVIKQASQADVEKIQEFIELELIDFIKPREDQLERMDRAAARKLIEEKRRDVLNRELEAYTRPRRGQASPAAGLFTTLIVSARDGKAEDFHKALEQYKSQSLANVPAGDLQNVRAEAYYLDHLAPFYYLAFGYLFVIVLGLVGWLVFPQTLSKSAFRLGLMIFLLHTTFLILRMVIMGRPPVTNLYSSAVFIGWGAVGLCLLLEAIYRNGVGTVVAGAVGAATLKIADFLGGSGDTMNMLVAVLDTNFWLAVHVTTVTLGYTATFVGGAIGIIYILRGVLSPSFTQAHQKDLGGMMYGVICFATLLSFFGTVAGGIWADYSWGRFWGWDPKENGAVLIVIWNALILHARWCGLVKNRGMAILAVFGNVVTAWSWFGTNQLQIGLHSYGFDNRLASGCFWFWVSQFAIMGIGSIPTKFWLSTNARPIAQPV